MVLARVSGIARRRPPKDELDNANPVRNDDSGLWQCPFCQQDDFPELSEVSFNYVHNNLSFKRSLSAFFIALTQKVSILKWPYAHTSYF